MKHAVRMGGNIMEDGYLPLLSESPKTNQADDSAEQFRGSTFKIRPRIWQRPWCIHILYLFLTILLLLIMLYQWHEHAQDHDFQDSIYCTC
jgi:hypothetical protein